VISQTIEVEMVWYRRPGKTHPHSRRTSRCSSAAAFFLTVQNIMAGFTILYIINSCCWL